MSTLIVAPLGTIAIAAHSLAITVESLCYMPGYGIADAATTLVGQSFGAGQQKLTKSFARMSMGLGMIVMTVMGILMYIFASELMSILTPVTDIIDLGNHLPAASRLVQNRCLQPPSHAMAYSPALATH